jgi:hypothetical protein
MMAARFSRRETMPGIALALFAYAALTTVPAPGELPESGEVDIVYGKADAADRMTVPVRIGDKGPYRFLIDTGSQKTVLSTDLAAQLALSSIEMRRIVGIAGMGSPCCSSRANTSARTESSASTACSASEC